MKLDNFINMMTGHFDNKEQFDMMQEAGKSYPYAEHVNTVCNDKIKNIPADFNGKFIVEDVGKVCKSLQFFFEPHSVIAYFAGHTVYGCLVPVLVLQGIEESLFVKFLYCCEYLFDALCRVYDLVGVVHVEESGWISSANIILFVQISYCCEK